MKAPQVLIVAISSLSISGMAFGGNKTQPPAPSQNNQPRQSSQSSSSNSGTSGSNSGTSNSGTPGSNSNKSGTSSDSSKNPNNSSNNPYPYGYPYGNPYGYPNAGVYYPQGNNPNNNPSSSSSSSSTTTPPANNNPAPVAPDAGAPAPSAPWRTTPTAAPPAPAAPADPELAAATSEYNTAVDAVREKLKSHPDYQAALEEKKAARLEAMALHEKSDIAPTDTLAVAQRGLEASQKLSQIEKEAMAKDDRVVAARARLDAALTAHAGNAGAAAAAAPK